MSAFSCGPGQGSEAGIGWNWALETARLGHEVTVITSTEFSPLIEAEVASGRLPPNLTFQIFMPGWLTKLRDRGLRGRFKSMTWFFTNLAWQLVLPSHVRKLYPDLDFDLVHHVTFGTIRHPTCLGGLGLPLVLGPLGGGESGPAHLRRGLAPFDRLAEGMRLLHTWTTRFDPISRSAFADASVIIVRTDETKAVLPTRLWSKVVCNLGIGVEPQGRAGTVPRRDGDPLRVIFAGRLLAWKGLHLGLEAVSGARRAGADIRLTVVGDGPQRRRLQEQADRLDLGSTVEWRSEIPRSELLAIYEKQHAVLIPSLHDSGGMAVLEGLSRGLPVICLALGGPGVMIDDACGRAVSANGSQAEVVERLRRALLELADSENLRLGLSRGALARAGELSWSRLVKLGYDDIAARLGLSKPVAPRAEPARQVA
ncbi:glycosyltransferase involved in cell wall biosynthesis [Methylobacterium brachythecii]|nr:glycosyltransferase involved in cell wall biosynthesis [Methylobacterium brachythecii]